MGATFRYAKSPGAKREASRIDSTTSPSANLAFTSSTKLGKETPGCLVPQRLLLIRILIQSKSADPLGHGVWSIPLSSNFHFVLFAFLPFFPSSFHPFAFSTNPLVHLLRYPLLATSQRKFWGIGPPRNLPFPMSNSHRCLIKCWQPFEPPKFQTCNPKRTKIARINISPNETKTNSGNKKNGRP